jgi:hypothetical protein
MAVTLAIPSDANTGIPYKRKIRRSARIITAMRKSI